ncbi:MAG TPA: caspase family protein [Blastocatellia bacterium]|nr:caspase family protein [Blastocatellia bacterium]
MPKKLLTLVILFAALAMTAGGQQPVQGARTWAIVIGISKYQKLPGGQQLQFADRDAALFAEAIQKRGVSAQNVRLLTGAEATAAAIKSAVGNWLARSVSNSDTVLIFFSGHGLFEREFGESYLLGYDSDPKDPYGTALSVSELGQALARRVRSGRVLLMADAVRRDFFDPESDPNSAKAFEQSFEQLTTSRPGLSAIIASGPGEFSREGQRWGGHGVFAKHLADVLFDGADRNADLATTADELFHLLKGRVAEDTSGKQHPWRTGGGLAQPEVARVQSQNAPPITPGAELIPKTAPPGVAASSRPSDEKETRTQPEQKKDVVVGKPMTSSQPPAEIKPGAQSTGRPGPVEKPGLTEKRPVPGPSPANTIKKESVPAEAAEKKPQPVPTVIEKTSGANAAPKPAATSSNVAREPAAPKPSVPRAATPPGTQTMKSTQPVGPPGELARADIPVAEIPTAPKPSISLPSAVVVSAGRAANQPETLSASVPSARPEAAPSPLVLQLEAAIASKSLIEPGNGSAWDLYQRMLSEPSTAADATRLKPVLAEALTAQGRAIVSGDVRGDNISEKVDDFKRAGQMLARARALAPDNGDAGALEKLSAAEALISLQFYDEAERALAPLQNAKLAAVENALGLVYQGKLDTWRAERAFKRASELDSKWAAPHYNLALLYRSQQNQAALAEFEAAASSDQSNVNLLAALGDEFFTRQQWKPAAEAFRKAVALKPSDDNLHTKLGHALYSQGLQDEANREYQKAQELRRKQP